MGFLTGPASTSPDIRRIAANARAPPLSSSRCHQNLLRKSPNKISAGERSSPALSRSHRSVISLSFPRVFGPCVLDRLRLQIDNRIRSVMGERHNVIFSVARTGTGCFPGQWTGNAPVGMPASPRGIVIRWPKAELSCRARSPAQAETRCSLAPTEASDAGMRGSTCGQSARP
jgi:hypothetical protein